MGTVLDLNRSTSHDYVDTPFWSVNQIRVKYLLHGIYVNKFFDEIYKRESSRPKFSEEEAVLA